MVDRKAKLMGIVIICIMCCIGVLNGISFTVVPSQIESSSPFELRCNIPLLAGIVRIFKDGLEKGLCTAPIPGIINGKCVPENLKQSITTNDTIFTFDSADPPAHHGEWKCRHVSKETVRFINIYVFPTVLSSNDDEINETINAIEASETLFRVNASECVNPAPEITWYLKRCNDSKADIGVSKHPIVQSYPSLDCVAPQRQYSSSLKVKDMSKTEEEVCFMALALLTYPGTDFPALKFSFTTYVLFKGVVTTRFVSSITSTRSTALSDTTTKSSTDAMTITVAPSQLESSTAFELRCNIPLLAGIVKISKDGIAIGACTAPIPGIINGICVPANLQQSIVTNDTILRIKSANLTAHHGEWKCQHVSQETVKFITIYAFPTTLSNNQHEINGTINVVKADDTAFRVNVSECVNPEPEIKWLLKTCRDGEADFNIANNPMVQSYPSVDCLSPQRKYISSLRVKDMVRPMEDICYMVSALLMYPGSDFPALMSSFTTYIFFKEKSTTSSNSTASPPGSDDGPVVLVAFIVYAVFVIVLYSIAFCISMIIRGKRKR